MTEMKQGKKYDAKIRKRAAKILATGVGHRALAVELGIPEATARQWARSYAVGGQAAVMNAGSTHRVYPYELKLSVVRDRVENGMSVREVMIKHGVPASRRSRPGAASTARAAPRRSSASRVAASPRARAPSRRKQDRGFSRRGRETPLWEKGDRHLFPSACPLFPRVASPAPSPIREAACLPCFP